MSALARTLSGALRSIRSVLRQGAAGSAEAGETAQAAKADATWTVALVFAWASIAWTPTLLASSGRMWSTRVSAETGVPESSLLARVGIDPDGAPKTPTIVIVFQAADCAAAREDLLAWNDRDVRVHGVVVGAVPDGPRGLALVIGDAGLTFPVSPRTGGWWEGTLRSMGYERTPILMAIDGTGRLREVGPLANYADEQATQDLLARLISIEETDT